MSTWLRNFSISRRLIIIITSINLVIILLMGLIAINSNRRALESQATRQFVEKNRHVASHITTELNKVMASVNRMQVALSVLESYSQSQLRTVVRNTILQDEDMLIYRVSVYRPSVMVDGEEQDDSVVVMQIFEPRTGAINETRTFTFDNQQPPPDSPMFLALERNEPIWFTQDTAYQDSQHRGSISLAIPYDYSSDVQGVIWVDIPRPVFEEMVAQQLNLVALLADTVNGFALLMDKNDNLIYGYGEQASNLTATLISDLMTRMSEVETVDNLNPVENPLTEKQDLAAVDLLPVNGWQLVSILPRDDIPTPTDLLVFQLVLVTIVGMGITVIAVDYFTQRAIVAPLRNLSRAAQEIGSGDLRYHIDYRGYDDEIGSLARALEGMKGNLANSYTELQNWSRTVTARVYERTKELNETRKIAEYNANELQEIYDESLIVVNEPELEPILNAFTERILGLLNASYCSIWLLDDTREKMTRVTCTQGDNFVGITVDADQGMVGQSFQKQDVIIVDDYSTYEHQMQIADRIAYGRAMVVPLIFDGSPMGGVIIGRTADSQPFTEANTRSLTLFANLVSPAVRNAQLFNQREVARHEAERANQVKTRFLASVTHELRTPLNLIINNMDFMRIGDFGDVNDDQVLRLNQTVRSAEHLLYLINDLLDVSKIDAGEMQLFIQPNDMHIIIEDSIDTTVAFMEKIDGKTDHVRLVSEVDDKLPKIPMDSRRIRQVITNLLSNAVKFTNAGEVKLTVKAVDEGITVAVQDSGIGVPPSEVDKLFVAFERTSNAKEYNIEGTGLGLPISQYLVQQHGGVLEVESVEGQGATFRFTLPYTHPAGDTSKRDSSMAEVLKSDQT